jgi:hypothetical protein
MLKPNNILSYFIKDIKDPKECALYKQMNTTSNNIDIFYKDELIHRIQLYKLKPAICWNYTNNISKEYLSGRIINYKIDSNKSSKYNTLFYKKDKRISENNGNHILYGFNYNKYLNKYLIKKYLDYLAEFKSLLCIKIKYYNGCIYKGNHKYKHVRILIMNKYELHYINRFFNIYN